MKLEKFIAKKISSSGQKERNLSKPIVRIAVGGIILGVTVMILTVFIVKGFQNEVRERTFAFGGHIQVQHTSINNSPEPEPISEHQDFLNELKKDERIRHFQRYAYKSGVIKTKKENEGILLKAVGQEFDWGFIGENMVEGKVFDPAAKTEKNQILISKILSDRLGLVTGDKMFIYFLQQKKTKRVASDESHLQIEVPEGLPLTDSSGKANPQVQEEIKEHGEEIVPDTIEEIKYEPRNKEFIISGIYETGMEEFDRKIVFSTLNVVRSVNGWKEDQVGGYEIWINDLKDLDETEENTIVLWFRRVLEQMGISAAPKEYLTDKVYSITPSDISAMNVKQSNPAIFEWLDMHDTTAWIVLILMIVVSVINMISALIILIIEKTNMIGMLKALGMDNKRVKKIFLIQASGLIGKGLIWGNIAGLSLAALQYYFHLIKLDQSTYYISFVPISFEWWYLIFLNAGTYLLCLLFMLLPAIVVSRTTPIKAIRFN